MCLRTLTQTNRDRDQKDREKITSLQGQMLQRERHRPERRSKSPVYRDRYYRTRPLDQTSCTLYYWPDRWELGLFELFSPPRASSPPISHWVSVPTVPPASLSLQFPPLIPPPTSLSSQFPPLIPSSIPLLTVPSPLSLHPPLFHHLCQVQPACGCLHGVQTVL